MAAWLGPPRKGLMEGMTCRTFKGGKSETGPQITEQHSSLVNNMVAKLESILDRSEEP